MHPRKLIFLVLSCNLLTLGIWYFARKVLVRTPAPANTPAQVQPGVGPPSSTEHPSASSLPTIVPSPPSSPSQPLPVPDPYPVGYIVKGRRFNVYMSDGSTRTEQEHLPAVIKLAGEKGAVDFIGRAFVVVGGKKAYLRANSSPASVPAGTPVKAPGAGAPATAPAPILVTTAPKQRPETP